MTIKGKAYIIGAYEHPLRKAPVHSVAQLHAEVAKGAIEDAGLSRDDIDGFFCAGDAPGANVWSMANYLNLNRLRHVDSTDMGMLILGTRGPRGRGDRGGQVQRGAHHPCRPAEFRGNFRHTGSGPRRQHAGDAL